MDAIVIRDLRVEALIGMLPYRVGSPLSINSLRETVNSKVNLNGYYNFRFSVDGSEEPEVAFETSAYPEAVIRWQ